MVSQSLMERCSDLLPKASYRAASYCAAAYRTASFCGALALILGSVSPAHAGELHWQATALCPEREQLAFQLERALGRPLEHATPLEFALRLERAGAELRAHLQIAGQGSGASAPERVLVAADCEQLLDALGVAITLAVGSAAAREQAPPQPVPDVAMPAPAEPAAVSTPAPVPDPGPAAAQVEAAVGWRWGVSLWLLGDTGALPRPGVGAGLGLSAGGARLYLQALGSVLFEQHAGAPAAADPKAQGGELGLATGSVAACVRPARSAQWLALCLGGEVGRLAGSGTGLSGNRRAAAPWLAPRADLSASFALSGTQLRAGVLLGALAPLRRDEFVIDGAGTLHRPPSLAGRAALGIEFQSP